MTRVDRLDVVQQVADRAERERAERLAEAERNAIEAEQKLVALERYRNEYEEQLATRGAAGVEVSGVREFQAFLARLGEALVAQRQVLGAARATRDQLLNSWREAAQRAQVVQTLADRWHSEARRDEDRRDQRESDELAQRGSKNER
ncbi:MAG TPA: flagellar export protein FliJ [Steroidobacteraceae bacterium]|jgi:flagellar FliJ protein|nr:flagellar export protein FliJ [Steroidobacteraceae bacterium]